MTVKGAGKISLKVDGLSYEGWTGLQARRSIETIAGSFEVTVSEHWTGQSTRPIHPGKACQLLLDENPVITGFIDDFKPAFSNDNHTIQISGRCKTGDLVDCSAIYKSGQWFGRKIEQIAKDLCEPFGITVIVETDTGAAFTSFNIQPGETVFECIERAARMRALLLISDASGNLVIARASKVKIATRLIQGGNILAASGQFSWRDRYSFYTIKGQSSGTDEWHGRKAAQGVSDVVDRSVTRYRPLVVISPDQGSGETLSKRASWEKHVRFGRGSRGTISVQGWSHADGLWMPNSIVDVDCPFLDLNAAMLIAAVVYSIDEGGGTKCELEIVRPEAFDLVEGIGREKLSKKFREKELLQKRLMGIGVPAIWRHDSMNYTQSEADAIREIEQLNDPRYNPRRNK